MGSERNGFFRRFSRYRILEHWAAALIFVVMAATGLSQKFHYLDLSQWFVVQAGGIDAVRMVHRMGGLLLALLIGQHIGTASFGVLFRGWKPLMVVTEKDLSDLEENLKYYFGFSDRPARCDRYDYRQKFEYWGCLFGAFIMIASGFVLWFPMSFASFFPGELIPAAKALHSNHAMLIFFLIVLSHIYNSVFSPDVFPMDTTIFTGRISRERMEREHPLELAGIEGKNPGEGPVFGHPEPSRERDTCVL